MTKLVVAFRNYANAPKNYQFSVNILKINKKINFIRPYQTGLTEILILLSTGALKDEIRDQPKKLFNEGSSI
jgi:hypothetical protein